MILDYTNDVILQNIGREKEAATSYFALITNLVAISPKFADHLLKKYWEKMFSKLVARVFKKGKVSSKFNRLKEHVYGLVTNLIRDEKVRVSFLNLTPELEQFYTSIVENLNSFTIQD